MIKVLLIIWVGVEGNVGERVVSIKKIDGVGGVFGK